MDDKRLAEKPLSDAVKADLVRDYHQLICKFAGEAYQLPNGPTFGQHSDWYQEAALALIEAAERWDHTRGIRFITFAYRWVRGTLLNKSRHGGVVRVPRPSGRNSYARQRAIALRRMEDVYETDAPDRSCDDDGPEVSLKCLTPYQRDIIRRVYGFDGPEETQVEVARSLGITRAAVGWQHTRALERLLEDIRS